MGTKKFYKRKEPFPSALFLGLADRVKEKYRDKVKIQYRKKLGRHKG